MRAVKIRSDRSDGCTTIGVMAFLLIRSEGVRSEGVYADRSKGCIADRSEGYIC